MRTSDRGARRILALVAAIMVSVAIAAPVGAGSGQRVTIVSHVTFNPDGPNFGDFAATGPAADSGLICATGTFVDTGIRFAGYQSGRNVVQLQVYKSFTCGDGSGTFDVKLQINADFETGLETFSWVVTDGSDDYAALRGGGDGSTVPNPPTGNINTYEGFLLH